MSRWSRFANVFRSGRLNREIDEELASHIDEAIASGRDPEEARRAFGSALRQRESSRDVRLASWLGSLRADSIFGWRQLQRHKVASAAAIVSLALAIGACTTAFRLIDALLLRPMPISDPQRLYVVAFTGGGVAGGPQEWDSGSYPMFERMRDAVSQSADLIAVSYMDWADVSWGSDQEIEKAHWQYVSGRMFPVFGLKPAAGRLLTSADDLEPGAHPYAVTSYDYWTRRFARDPGIIGRRLRRGETLFEIVGVAPKGFTGTETGTVTDIFAPMMMSSPEVLASANNFWLRIFAKLRAGARPEPTYDRLRATFQQIQVERARTFVNITKSQLRRHFEERVLLEPAAAGRSNLQRDYRRPLATLALLVGLVLLIACANVSNLMTARAAVRAKEMALRVSIGAGRGRLAQLLIVECAWLALLATAVGGLFAWWAGPFLVARINPADNPARLELAYDWRLFAFSLALAAFVALLFGMAPALRASGVKPAGALKGGEDPHGRRRVMRALIGVQVAFCFVVLFVAGLFIASFEKLSIQPVGFSADRILNLQTITTTPQPVAFWNQLADTLRAAPGVERVALTLWPMMSGESSAIPVSINGAPPPEALCDLLTVSPGWFETMKIPLINGRDFRAEDASPGVAIVNRAFAREYFNGEDPVGKWFEHLGGKSNRMRLQIVGFVPDARSRDNLRFPIRPTAYAPFQRRNAAGAWKPESRGTFVVRTAAADPLALAPALRRLVNEWRPGFHVDNIRTQLEINRSCTIRERLLASLALFFAIVALVLGGVGLYGVLDYSVLQRQREIGVRIAIGARRVDIARGVIADVSLVVALGAAAGVLLGMVSARYIASLLYEVKATELLRLAAPACGILVIVLIASLRPVFRALRIDPAETLRVE
jgi:predicted permease